MVYEYSVRYPLFNPIASYSWYS